jgi:hypothetical protein
MKKRCSLRTIFVILLNILAASGVVAVPADIAKDLEKPRITRSDRSVGTMPSALKKSMKKAFRTRALLIADPGRPYLDTDFVTDSAKARLPVRRLAIAFATPRFYYVYYRAGGYEDAGKLLIFKIVNGRYEFAWGGVEFERDPSSPAEIIKRLRRKSFDDTKKFFW